MVGDVQERDVAERRRIAYRPRPRRGRCGPGLAPAAARARLEEVPACNCYWFTGKPDQQQPARSLICGSVSVPE
jgi:hypothetical protein